MLFDNHDHLPKPFGLGTVRAFIGVRPPGILLPHREARLVSADYPATGGTDFCHVIASPYGSVSPFMDIAADLPG
jgi:hypothetical protein